MSPFPTISDPSISTQSLRPRSSPGSCVIISKRICPRQPCFKAFRRPPIVLKIKARFPSTICKALQGLILILSPPDSLCTCCSSTSAPPPSPPPPPLVNTDGRIQISTQVNSPTSPIRSNSLTLGQHQVALLVAFVIVAFTFISSSLFH